MDTKLMLELTGISATIGGFMLGLFSWFERKTDFRIKRLHTEIKDDISDNNRIVIENCTTAFSEAINPLRRDIVEMKTMLQKMQ